MWLKQILSNNDGKYSHTKLFASIAYTAATYAFIYKVHNGTDTIELWLVYLGIVASSATVSKLLALLYGSKTRIAEIKHNRDDNY